MKYGNYITNGVTWVGGWEIYTNTSGQKTG